MEETCKYLNSTCSDAEYRKNKKQRKVLNFCPDGIDSEDNPIVCCFPPIKSNADEIVGYPLIIGIGGRPVTFTTNYSVYPHMVKINLIKSI